MHCEKIETTYKNRTSHQLCLGTFPIEIIYNKNVTNGQCTMNVVGDEEISTDEPNRIDKVGDKTNPTFIHPKCCTFAHSTPPSWFQFFIISIF